MKTLMGTLSLTGLLVLGIACNRSNDLQKEDATPSNIQREEALDADDIRETDSYDRSVPVESDEEIDDDQVSD